MAVAADSDRASPALCTLACNSLSRSVYSSIVQHFFEIAQCFSCSKTAKSCTSPPRIAPPPAFAPRPIPPHCMQQPSNVWQILASARNFPTPQDLRCFRLCKISESARKGLRASDNGSMLASKKTFVFCEGLFFRFTGGSF